MRVKRKLPNKEIKKETPVDLSLLEPLLLKFKDKKGNMIPLLQGTQIIYGYIPKKAIEEISLQTGLPANEIYGVATFYSQFRLNPVGKYIIKVCQGTPCHVMGSQKITDALAEFLGINDNETTEDKMFTLESVACVGCCSLAPVMVIGDDYLGYLTGTSAVNMIKQIRKKDAENSGIIQAEEPFIVKVGLGSCGIAAGAEQTYKEILKLKIDQDLDFQLKQTSCIGMCFREPLVEVIDGEKSFLYGNVNKSIAEEIIENHIKRNVPLEKYIVDSNVIKCEDSVYFKTQNKISLRNCGIIDPENIDEYIGKGGYFALKNIVTKNITPDEVIDSILKSGLRGRGGGGFSTGKKWSFAANAKGDKKYIVCNADEGDPGAFMDRSILEGDPHSIIEGMLIAAFAIGASEGVIYCRAEYPLALKRLDKAILDAKKSGFLGHNIFGKIGFDFDLFVKEGAGAFVCGEETALLASIEGKRGMPSIRPPFPAEKGLWGMPTVINNVETFSNISWIIKNGAEKFSLLGTEKSKGTKVFALVGTVKRTGLVEVPMGMTIREIVYNIGGGHPKGEPIKAVQLGGPSGGCIPESLFDTKIDYDSLQKIGAMMGSGGLLVMDNHTCMVDIAHYFMEFIQKESCGKCTSCRVGTSKMYEILKRIVEGFGVESDLQLLEELSYQIKEGSLCGLGQTAPNPVLTTLKYFREEYESHIIKKRCPAKVCKELLTYRVIESKCPGCRKCVSVCSVDAILGDVRIPHYIDQKLCTKCNACFEVCDYEAIKII